MRKIAGPALLLALCGITLAAPPTREEVLAAMKKATTYMNEKVSNQGGYAWSYAADLSRRWGEMESGESIVWLQFPSTPLMGQALLDAYHATGDEYYYDAAAKTARLLVSVQHPSGGWNYLADLAGEDSLKKWYATIGKNGWRLEEYQHYYGNATFDDDVTNDAARFMLRIWKEKNDPAFKASFDKALAFVLESQYPNGGWPQRFPLIKPGEAFSKKGLPDYTGFITFNDSVCADNVDFLIQCYEVLGDKKLLDPIARGMDIYVQTQQKAPQAGWGLQHDPVTLAPEGARTYEPKALVTSTTSGNIALLIKFYGYTGDKKFLARIPEALTWLDSVKLSPELAARGTHPTFVEIGTNKPLFVHRRGSNATNGEYFVDGKPMNTVMHYSSFRRVDTDMLRKRYEAALTMSAEVATKDSPLRQGAPRKPLPRFVATRQAEIPPGTQVFGRGPGRGMTEEERLTRAMNLSPDGAWLTTLRSTSNPFKGDGPLEVAPGDFVATNVGDAFDTSPYRETRQVMGITVQNYVENLGTLIRYLENHK